MRQLSLNLLLLVTILSILPCSFALAEKKKGKAPEAQQKPVPRVRPSEDLSGADVVTEKRSDGTTVKYKKKTTYDFEGASIEGLYNKPSGSYISNIKDVKGKSIVRIRENFDAEVMDSSRQLK